MSKMRKRIKRALPMRRLVYGITSLIFGAVAGVLTTWLTGPTDLWALPYLLAGLVLFGLLSVVLFIRASEAIDVVMAPPIPIRTDEERELYARQGLVVFISLYNPFKSETAKNLGREARLDAARTADYKVLDIMNSNLEPAIRAVTSHTSALQHCWLIATTAQEKEITGSLPYVEAVVAFLKEQVGLTCEFHRGPKYAIALDDDALVYSKTYELIRRIYTEAEELGILPNEMIADFTGCPRSMTLGMILATLSLDQDIQFMGTRYNADSRPEGPLFPIIFRFEPKLTAPD